ncbi:hypothetical protein [Streptomyces sp. NPDC056987]|uniref:hypothetical protein n=1 Tax=Streptomyces sp. NPDC056987 TaxID=3345988 RepID=UPI0036318A33
MPTDGVDALERILTAGHHQVAYSPLDIAQWTAPYPALSTSTLLAPLLTGQEATQDETEVRDRLLGAEGPAARQDILETFSIDFETTQVPETERGLRRMVSRLKRQLKDQRALMEELRRRNTRLALAAAVLTQASQTLPPPAQWDNVVTRRPDTAPSTGAAGRTSDTVTGVGESKAWRARAGTGFSAALDGYRSPVRSEEVSRLP